MQRVENCLPDMVCGSGKSENKIYACVKCNCLNTKPLLLTCTVFIRTPLKPSNSFYQDRYFMCGDVITVY